jgi:hypothetical protein
MRSKISVTQGGVSGGAVHSNVLYSPLYRSIEMPLPKLDRKNVTIRIETNRQSNLKQPRTNLHPGKYANLSD